MCVQYVYKSVLYYQPTHPLTTYPMQQQNNEVKIQQQHTCSTCGRSFNFIEELKIHQYSKHGIAHKKQSSNDTQSNLSVTAQIPQPTSNKRKLTRQKKKEQSTRQNDKNSRTETKLVQQTVERQSQQHSEKQQPQNLTSTAPTAIIPQPPPVTPTDDLYQKIYLCGCNNKFFEHKQDLSLHIKKQHLGFPPDGTLIGVSKDLVLKQFKPTEYHPRYVYKYKKKTSEKQPQGGAQSKPSFEHAQEEQSHKSVSSNNQSIKDQLTKDQSVKDARKICSFCGVECTGKIKVCRDCSNWKYCGRCPLGALSWEQHIQSEHRIYTM